MDRGHRVTGMMISAALAVGLFLGGVSAQTGASGGAQRDIIAGLLAGRDMSGPVADYTAALASEKTQWSDPDRFAPDPLGESHQQALTRTSRQASRLARADQPWQNSQDLERLLTSLNQLQGQQMILEQRARRDLERLRNVEQAQDNVSRGEEALQQIALALAEIDAQIAVVQSLPGKSVDSREDEQEWTSALKGVADSLKAMEGQSESRARPILRALPFDRPLISPGPLVTGPGIDPSYEQADPQPGGSADLAASKGAPLSDIILAKAAELGNDYVAIHEFVRTQIRTEYYSGGLKGAETTLRTRAGNDVDQASLLIALYRASNVPARYVHGVARVAIEQVGAPLGLTDAQQVLTALSRAGIPHEPVIQGGQIGAVDMAATWVSIYVPYANYRGVPVDLAGRIWLPLSPAFKPHSVEPASGIAAASALDGEALVTSYLADEIADPPLVAARNQVEAYLAANPGLGSYADQLGTISVAAPAMKLLPAGLPFETVAVVEETTELSQDRQQSLTLIVSDDLGQEIMNEQVALTDLLDKRLTFSYAPATVGDFNTIREFGGRTAVPAYLVRLKPQLKADGAAIATAEGDLGMGEVHSLTLELNSPGGSRTASATLTAGSYAALGLSAQLGLPELVSETEPLADDSEGRAARLLYNQAARYASLWDQAEDELAGLFDVAVVRPLPALALVSTAVQVSQVQGLNSQLSFEAVNLDAAVRSVEPVSRAGDPVAESQWMRLAALQGSYLESTIFESQWAVESISADKGLRQAIRQTLPVAEIDAANAGSIIPGLSHAPEVIEAVQGAVDQGYRVLIPESEITFNAWTGSVWHSWNPDLGSSGYFISGGLAGGSTTEEPADWVLNDLANVLGNPYGGEPNTDPNSAAKIRIVPTSDGQFEQAGEILEKPLTVLVTDVDGRPVQGAAVQFNVVLGDAGLGGGGNPGASFETTTDSAGLAQAPVQVGTSTSVNPLYVFLEPGDEFSTQVSENWIQASVAVGGGFSLPTERPFYLYTLPNEPAQLVGITSPPIAYPQSWAGPAQARLEDQYGNPVSNREIRYSALPAIRPSMMACENPVTVSPARLFTGDECPIPSTPGLDCGFPEVTVTSNVFGPFVQVVTGEGVLGTGLALDGRTQWPVEVSSPGVPSITFAVSTLESLTRNEPSAITVVTKGSFDNIVDSALVDEIAPAPRQALTFRAEGGLCTPLSYVPDDVDVLAYRVVDRDEDGAFIINVVGTAPGIPVAPMTYEAFLPVGPEPIIHGSNLDLTFTTQPSGSVRTTTSRTFGITAVEAEIVSVNPVPVLLNLNGETTEPIVVEYNAQPANMRASLQVNLLEDGNVIDFKFLARGPNEGTVNFAPGKSLDIFKDYTVQLLVNPRTPFEIATDTFPVELTEPIVRSVTNIGSPNTSANSPSGGGLVEGDVVRSPLSFFNDIDIPNERICRMADLNLELTQPATVSMEFERLDVSGDPTGQVVEVLSNASFPAGTHQVTVSADDLGTDSYRWRIDAVSDLDGSIDIVFGGASSSFIQRNSLPIGHPIVKGVDLATGKMTLSRQDISVPGLGANLRFERSYSSGTRSEPSVIGAGWTHNYISRIVKSMCGDWYITGADGGSMRFVEQDGGYVPLKGYHGSLIRNAEDDSFDFYPKSGVRYRYTRRQDRSWWLDSIRDPNGNTTTLAYEPGPDAPLLSTVTDSSGRTLTFTYVSRDFRTWSGDVLTSVQGPDGIRVDFQYDEFGNLISSAREAGSTVDNYGYMTGSNVANANLLVSVTDAVINATRTYDYDEITLSSTIGSATLDILSSTVVEITETDAGTTGFSYTAGPWGMNELAVVTDARGNATTYRMNEYGAAESIAAPNGTRTRTWETETDVLLLSETDENGRVSSFTYDEFGNLTSETMGRVSKNYTYWPPGSFSPPYIKNRPASFTDPRGNTTTISYDSAGNTTTESLSGVTTTYTYDGNGNRLSATDGNGNLTTFGYDGFGYLTSSTDGAGNQWQFDWDVRGRKRVETDPNGNVTRFQYDNRDRLTRTTYADGSFATVDYNDGARTRVETDTRGNPTTYTHDAMVRVLSMRNAAGDTMSMSYDLKGNKTSETDFAGRTTTFSYDGADRLIGKNEPEGRIVTLGYDGLTNVLSRTVTGPGGNRTTTYSYDPDLYLPTSRTQSGLATSTRDYDPSGNIISETDPLGRAKTFTYDAFDRRITADGPLGSGMRWTYDGFGNVLSETTLNTGGNRENRYVYDAANRQVQFIDAEGGVWSTEYDAVGNLVRQVDARGKATAFEYDNRNRKSRTIDALGFETRLTHDTEGNLVEQIQPNGNVWQFAYDELNRKSSESDSIGPLATFAYDPVGNLVGQTDARGALTSRDFDGLNRLSTETRPEGRSASYTYNVFGETVTETDAAGSTVTHTYNSLGQRTSSVGPLGLNMQFTYDLVGNQLSKTDSRSNVTSFTYNELDQMVGQVDPLYSQSFGYDLVGNRIRHTDARGIVSTWSFDRANRLLERVRAGIAIEARNYDANGNVIFIVDANGNQTGLEYNDRNEVIRENRPELAISTFARDAMGDVTTEVRPAGRTLVRTYDLRRRLTSATNGAGETVTYEYDATGNQTAMLKPVGRWESEYDLANRLVRATDPLGNETRFAYDTRDNRISQTDANNRATTFVFDARNRITSKTYPDTAQVIYGYDAEGNLVSQDQPNGISINYNYDALNRQSGINYALAGDTIDVSIEYDPNGNMTRIDEAESTGAGGAIIQSFDDFDRVTVVTDRFGQTLQYAYDRNGNRTSLLDFTGQTSSYAYDALNRVSTIAIPGLGTAQYQYLPNSLLSRLTYPNGATAEYEYDLANRPTELANSQGGEAVAVYRYEYDANGNRTRQEEENGGGLEVTTYTYDSADRLTGVGYPDRDVVYALDPVGNRLSEDITTLATGASSTRTYSYNSRDQLTGVSDPSGPLDITYTYDANGNQTGKVENGVTSAFSFNARNRMALVEVDGQPGVEFEYDYFGMRVAKTVSGSRSQYVYDDGGLIGETNTLGNAIARYHYGSDRLLAESRSTQNAYFLNEVLGSPAALTAQDGSLLARYIYDAWGNITRQEGSSEQPFGFTGYQLDNETGLYYAEDRYYDSFTGRFLREDPFKGDISRPPSLHRYLYAFANPTVFVDPDGNDSVRQIIRIDDESVQAQIDAGETGFTAAAGYAARVTGYKVWNFVTGGFLSRQDDRRELYDAGEITETEFNSGTLLDASVSIGASAVGGAVGNKVTGRLGTGIVGSAVSGAASGATEDLIVQSGEVLANAAISEELGRESVDLVQTAISAGTGAAVGGVTGGIQHAVSARQAKSAPVVESQSAPGPARVPADAVNSRKDLVTPKDPGPANRATRPSSSQPPPAFDARVNRWRDPSSGRFTKPPVDRSVAAPTPKPSKTSVLDQDLTTPSRTGSGRRLKPIVLGETMTYRVTPVANRLNAHTYVPKKKAASDAIAFRNQRQWIRRQIQSGRRMFDIGQHRGRDVRSDFYKIERETLIRNGYRRQFVQSVRAEVPDKNGNFVIKQFRLYEWIKQE